MRIVIIGGTFNPIHIGHLWLANEVKEQLKYDKVLFVPTHKPAHKNISSDILDEHRLHMLSIALEGLSDVSVETCEIYRQGISYSIDTVRCLKKIYNLSEPPGLVLGDDLFSSFADWKDASLLSQEASLIVAHRLYKDKLKSSFPHRYLDNIIIDVSSTYLRDRLKKGLPVNLLIPERVITYIKSKNLYES